MDRLIAMIGVDIPSLRRISVGVNSAIYYLTMSFEEPSLCRNITAISLDEHDGGFE
jgi:hypothetical protein